MRLESFPLVLGALLGLVGLALVLDAWIPDDVKSRVERRRRPRRDRDKLGEALVGLGALAMSATFLGRDTWRYSIFAVGAGALLLIWGTKRNGGYLRGVFTHHGRAGTAPQPTTLAEGQRRIR